MNSTEFMLAMGITEERRTKLLELIRQRGFASLPDLAEELEVSESTVRRDLDFLEEVGQRPADARRRVLHRPVAEAGPLRPAAAAQLGQEASRSRSQRAG